MKAGFIGLGRMGRHMAGNMVEAGVKLVVHDISAEAVEALVARGAEAAGSVADLARRCNVIFTSLPGPPEVEAVYLGADGMLDHIAPGTIVFDLSTSSRSLAMRLDEAFRAKGAHVLDAPVSGGPAGAESKKLVVWVGGDRAAFDRCESMLRAFSNAPHYVGAIGTGTITKLAHNALGYMIILAQSEVFSMAVKAGLDPLDLWEALRLGVVGKTSPLDALVNQFLPGVFDKPAFALKLGHKDMTLAVKLGEELGVPMQLAALTQKEMTAGVNQGFGEWDSRAFLQLQLQRAGVEIAVDPARLAGAVERAKKPAGV